MPEVPEMQVLPEILLESLGNIHFDYEAFQENEEEYMKEFERQMEENFGEDFEREMEEWGEQFERQFEEKYGPEWEAKMEAWGEKLEKNMEAWAEEFGEDMEKWAEQHEKQAEEWEKHAEEIEKKHEEMSKKYHELQKVNKTIIIKMPKNTKTDVNVRHGELKMADAYNVKVTLNYSTFTANSVDGGQTLINAAYAPVSVQTWKKGSLNINSVEECAINEVKTINLQAISSDVWIDLIVNSANLSGAIGNLQINNIADSFSSLAITLENTDATITLPKTEFSFSMDSTYSTLKNPKKLTLSKNNTLAKNVYIKAMYSDVRVQ